MEERQLMWRTSSRSSTNGGACVEIAMLSDQVKIRDSKDPQGPRLTVTAAEWCRFIAKIGSLD